jgi:hypothetical protein
MPTFSDQNIAKLFGAEAAEDEPEDRFRQYFFFNQTYENLISDLPLRILVGHKGVGKSALLKRAKLHDDDSSLLSVWLTPGDISAVATRDSGDDFTKLVEYWKQGIFAIIAKHVLGDAANDLLNQPKMSGFALRSSQFTHSSRPRYGGWRHPEARAAQPRASKDERGCAACSFSPRAGRRSG